MDFCVGVIVGIIVTLLAMTLFDRLADGPIPPDYWERNGPEGPSERGDES